MHNNRLFMAPYLVIVRRAYKGLRTSDIISHARTHARTHTHARAHTYTTNITGDGLVEREEKTNNKSVCGREEIGSSSDLRESRMPDRERKSVKRRWTVFSLNYTLINPEESFNPQLVQGNSLFNVMGQETCEHTQCMPSTARRCY